MKFLQTMNSWWKLSVALLVVGLVLGTGCKRSEPEKAATVAASKSSTAKPAERAVMSEDEASMLAPFMQGTNVSAADKAWNEMVKSFQPPAIPPQWQTNEPSKEEVAAFEKESAKMATNAAAKAKDFYTRFPEHERAEQARKLEMALLNQAAQLGDTNQLAKLQAMEEAQLKNPNLTQEQRLEVRMSQLQRRISSLDQENSAALLAELDKGVRALQKEFPDRAELNQILLTVAQGWMYQNEPEKSRAIAQEILKSDADEDVKADAEEIVKKLARLGKPLAMKFTALDGRAIDLEQMKGKVVLVDFWATWCAPCRAELPKVKAAYEKFHSQGFEIVGISFDDDKAALEKMLASEKMSWPQYFSTEGGKKWAEEMGISAIPTMWLVDKKGVLRELNARENLAGKVEKLLAEK